MQVRSMVQPSPYPEILSFTDSGRATSGTAVTVTLPPDRQVGDLMLCMAITYNATQTQTTGWTKILSPTTSSSSRLHAQWKICTGSEANTINMTFSTSDVHIVSVLRITNFLAATPINTQVAGGAASVTKNLSSPAITTTVPNCLIIRGVGSAVVSSQSGGAINYCNWPAPATEEHEYWGAVLSTNRLGISIASEPAPTAATYAARVAVSQPSTSPNSYGAGTIAIRPAA